MNRIITRAALPLLTAAALVAIPTTALASSSASVASTVQQNFAQQVGSHARLAGFRLVSTPCWPGVRSPITPRPKRVLGLACLRPAAAAGDGVLPETWLESGCAASSWRAAGKVPHTTSSSRSAIA